MARSSVVAGCLAGLLVACASGNSVDGSGTIKDEVRQLPAFTAVQLHGEIGADIQCQKPQSLTLTTDDNLLPLWETEVKDGVLTISPKDHQQPKGKQPAKVTITVPSLTKLSAAGLSTVTVNGIKAPSFAVDAAGAATFHLSGTVQDLSITGAGAMDCDAEHLIANTAKIDLSGAGKAVVNAKDTLHVAISGLGKVDYIGNPKVTKNVSGLGTVQQKHS